MKRFFKVLFIILLSIVTLIVILNGSLRLLYSDSKFATEREKIFLENIDNIEELNSLIIDSHDFAEEKYFYSTIFENESVVGLYDFPVKLNEKQIYSLNQINNSLYYAFNGVTVTKDCVSYGGFGDWFVYSINGSKPKYVEYKGDGIKFNSYKICDNWYYCISY